MPESVGDLDFRVVEGEAELVPAHPKIAFSLGHLRPIKEAASMPKKLGFSWG